MSICNSLIHNTHTSLLALIGDAGMAVEDCFEEVVGVGSFVLGDHVACSLECYVYYSRVYHLES